MKNKYVFKINKTAGEKYLQIWEWNDINKRYEYILACGNAEKLYKKLVKLEKSKNQTKE